LVSAEVLELARREAIVVETGKRGFAQSWNQDDINSLMIDHAQKGAKVVRLKSGDPVIYGRLSEELDALAQAGVPFEVVPGVTAASAAAASLGASLTQRGRNTSFRFITGHDVAGFADQNWRDLASDGSTAAVYMGKKSAAYLRGRLMMHGADAKTPVTIVENVSRNDQRMFETTLLDMPSTLKDNEISGPAVMLYGIKARNAAPALSTIKHKELA
jgi:uroporphyrin-III C-methyltransferase/precorrin-2 dehydrogenase/sirohydrochlorin ferrochelatase